MAGARRYAGRTVAARKAERRQQFLDAAARICAERGNMACSLAEICTSAGLSKRQFYEEFETRDDVLIATYVQVQHDAAAAVALALASMATVPADPAAVMRTGLTAYLVSIDSVPNRAKFALAEVIGVHEHTEKQCRELGGNWAAHIQRKLETIGIGLDGDRALHTVPLLAATVNAIARESMLRETKPPLSDLIDLLTDVVMPLVTRRVSADCEVGDL
ncbi:TetR/AcrR family transcriptional regulator [Nocardia sp. NPDC055029]